MRRCIVPIIQWNAVRWIDSTIPMSSSGTCRPRFASDLPYRRAYLEAEARFLAATEAAGMVGLKGHRSVGGLRASLYNAVRPEWVKALADLMREHARTAG